MLLIQFHESLSLLLRAAIFDTVLHDYLRLKLISTDSDICILGVLQPVTYNVYHKFILYC